MKKGRSPKAAEKSARKTRTRYKNQPFLKALGDHCRQLRVRQGYSIDRLSKEAEQLSPASIDRLERGTADSQILVLVRYAEALNLTLFDLFAFLKQAPDLAKDARILPFDAETKPPSGYVPVYPLKVAAGKFADLEENEDIQPVGWVDAKIRSSTQNYFAAFVRGVSMQPLIADGALCLFRVYTGGSRQGKVFLVQARGLKNNETGESFVLKKYVRKTPARPSADEAPAVVHLVSENPQFPPIILVGLSDDDIQTIAEFVSIL